jgi:cytoskeletal protein RodZ
MWLFILEAFAALLLFVFIIWWTMFSGRKNGELQDESQDQSQDQSSNSP